MQSVNVSFCLLLASIAVYSGHAFTSQVQLTNSRKTSSAIFGKRDRALKKVKKIFKSDDEAVEAIETQSNFSDEKVKLSNGRAKELAKKYKDIEDLGERAFQVLVDLNMVDRS